MKKFNPFVKYRLYVFKVLSFFVFSDCDVIRLVLDTNGHIDN